MHVHVHDNVTVTYRPCDRLPYSWGNAQLSREVELELEFVVLVIYFSIYFYLCGFNYSLFFVVYFLVFSVCEVSLGLSILVSIIRSHGNDYFQSYSVLQC
jgi:NADH:ubiquinone oxidoreductase subunit K